MAKRNAGDMADTSSDKRTSSSVASVLKAAKLIECFTRGSSALARGSTELALQELVAMSGYPTSTVHRLLSTLEQAGWVVRRRNGYSLSLRIVEIASHILAGLDLREEARPLMQQLSQSSQETVYLVMRQEDHAVCVERVGGKRMVRVMAWDVGSILPLHSGAAPLALLAFETAEEIDRLTKSPTLMHPIGHPTDRRTVLERLRLIREQGWSFSQDETFEDIASIGAPVLGPTGAPAAALSIGGMVSGFKPPRREEMAKGLLSAADRLSRLIGYTGAAIPQLGSTD